MVGDTSTGGNRRKSKKPQLRVEYVDHWNYGRDGKRFVSKLWEDGVLVVSGPAEPDDQRRAIAAARQSWKAGRYRPLMAKLSPAKRSASLVIYEAIGARTYRIYFAPTKLMSGVHIDCRRAEIVVADLACVADLRDALLEARKRELQNG